MILASPGAMLNGFCASRELNFAGVEPGKIEINSLSSLLSRCEIAFSMTKIGLIAKAAIENSNKLFVCMRDLVRKNQEVVHLLCSSLAANPVITSL